MSTTAQGRLFALHVGIAQDLEVGVGKRRHKFHGESWGALKPGANYERKLRFGYLAGRRWGSGVAGLLGGLPIVAGPIVVFIALENGAEFGALAASAAISAIAGLLVFGVAYCWASIRWQWPVALACGTFAWLITASCLALLPSSPELALIIAVSSLVITPYALPPSGPSVNAVNSLTDLPYRMFTGVKQRGKLSRFPG